LERYSEAYLAEMQHFVDCIEGNAAPSPSILDGLKAQVLADLATASMEENAIKAVVY